MVKKSEKKPLSDEESLALAQKRAEAKKAAVDDVLNRFGILPDEAHVRLPVVMALYACSAASVWRYVKNGKLPVPRKFGSRVTAWNVGELRSV
ncbi:MAG: AlpA family phage regulatory protein [Zoogloea sp.]|nr:AlpA family phage regulatory protein [Zoogloea sp.]